MLIFWNLTNVSPCKTTGFEEFKKRKETVKSKENMKVKNIPMADLSCSSPLPSADQVEIYVPHK